MLQITKRTAISMGEIDFSAVRSQGPGGQNVNKVASAIHLRFDVNASSLPGPMKERILARRDRRITKDGVIIIKAQQHRTQEQNREDALNRLQQMIREATTVAPPRKPTKPSRRARRRRVDRKTKRGQLKATRGNLSDSYEA